MYIGETSRPMSTRIKEHKAACRSANFERSAARLAGWSQHRNTRHCYRLHKQTHKGSYLYKATNSTCRMNRDGETSLQFEYPERHHHARKNTMSKSNPFSITITAIVQTTPTTDPTPSNTTTNVDSQEPGSGGQVSRHQLCDVISV